jgi:hypothetical protein
VASLQNHYIAGYFASDIWVSVTVTTDPVSKGKWASGYWNIYA